ncbi:MAG: DNA glycosylase AlkZ-like family protein, partial [Pseudonocardiaceae bacterium]
QASLHATDRSVAPPSRAFDTGLRPDPFPSRAASLLPGLLAATRTGLTPASDDELTTEDQPPTQSTSYLLGARTKLIAADVKTGLAIARPQLERIDVDGVEYFMHPETPALLDSYRSRAQGVFLLPGFDEYLLGYQDRGAALPREFAQRIVPGNNGMFQPTVIADGQVIGTWKRTGRGAEQTVLATPFTSFSSTVHDAIPRLYDALP